MPYKDFLTSVPTGNTGHTQIGCNTFKMSLIKRQLLKSGARLVLLTATNPYSLGAGRDKEWQWVLEFRKTQRGGRDKGCGEKKLWSQQARTRERTGGINTLHHHHLSSGLLRSSHWWNLSGSWRAKVFTDVISTSQPPRHRAEQRRMEKGARGVNRRDPAHLKHMQTSTTQGHTTFASIY